MSKLLSKSLIYPILMGMYVWIAGVSSASANPSADKVAEATPTSPTATRSISISDLAPLKATDSLAANIGSTAATPEQIEQATNATEVKPGDWAYQTLKELQAKYNCSDTATGDRVLSREEFATSLNGCVQSMEQLVARKRKPIKKKKRRATPAPSIVAPPPSEPEITPPPPEPVLPPAPVPPPAPVEPEVSQQDLDQVKSLVQSFSSDLQALDTKVQALDAKVTEVKDKSFSTTTKLTGEAIFALSGLLGGPDSATRTTIFSDRVRLNFTSSFTGKDALLVRLQSRNSNSFASIPNPSFNSNAPFNATTNNPTISPARTNEARLGFEGSEENATGIQRLQYKLPLSAQTKVYVEAVGSELNDNYENFNPELQSAGGGAVTRFGRFSSIYRLNNEGASVGLDQKFGPGLGLVLSYGVPRVSTPGVTPGTAPETVNNPTQGNGLFNGSNTLFSQLTINPSDNFKLGLAYARTYNSTGSGVSGSNGTSIANNPFGSGGANPIRPTTADHYSLLASVNLSKNLILSGWGGYTKAQRLDAAGNADIWEYALTVAAKDFGGKGNVLGLVAGMQPKLTSNSGATAARVDPATGLNFEAFYKYKVSDNLSITPGLLLLTNPENINGPAEYLGTIRTTFTF
jgi:hypothetical protein